MDITLGGNTTNKKQQASQQGTPQAQKPAQGGTSLFGEQKKPEIDPSKITELSTETKNITMRLRTLEEKYKNLRNEFQLSEKNVLEDHKKSNTEFKDINNQLLQTKKAISEIKEKIEIIIKELGLTAKQEKVMTIERYLALWNPVHFVSQHEIKNVVKRALLELGIESKNDVTTPESSISESDDFKKNEDKLLDNIDHKI